LGIGGKGGKRVVRPKRGCQALLGILILLLVVFPVLQDMARPILLTCVVASVFVAGVAIVETGPRRVRIAVGLAFLQLTFVGLSLLFADRSLPYAGIVSLALATMTVLICYCIYCVMRYVLQSNRITRDQIYAGISVYLMLGFAFGCIYFLTSILLPGSFSVNVAALNNSGGTDLMYFSFVTLATLGYGDITPIARFARALTQLEALAGSLYMAVFMARLVSMAVSSPADIQVSEARPQSWTAPRDGD
jgi:hypothetical protein